MRASLVALLSSALPLVAVACSGPADVVVTPTSSADPNAKRLAPSASVAALLVGPTQAPRVAGSRFSASADEPLPSGAIARCGTTSMRLRDNATLAVTNDGTIYAFRNGEELVDVRKDVVLAKFPRSQRSVFSADATKLLLSHSSDVIEIFALPSGKSLGSSKIDLTKPKPPKPPKSGGKATFGIGSIGRSEYIDDVEFSPDGSRVVVTTSFGAIHLLDATTGKRLKTQKVPNARLASVSRDASRALVMLREASKADVSMFMGASFDDVLGMTVINLTTGAKLMTKNFPLDEASANDPGAHRMREHKFAAHGLSLDGDTVYRLEHGTLSSIDVASGKEDVIAKPNAKDLWSGGGFMLGGGTLEMLADGRSARSGGRIIDLATGTTSEADSFVFESANGEYQLQRTGSVVHLSSDRVTGHTSTVAAVSFLPSGEALVTADGSLHFWDAATCEELEKPNVNASDFRAAQGEGVLVVDGYPALIVDAKGVLTELRNSFRARNLALSTDGSKLFVGTSEYEQAEIQILDRKGTALASVDAGGSVSGVAASPGGSRIAAVVRKDDSVELQVRKADTLAVEKISNDVDDQLLFLGEDRVLMFSSHRGVTERLMPNLEQGFKVGADDCCSVVAISKDQRLLAGASGEEIFVWELPEPKDGVITPRFLSQLTGHEDRVTSLSFSAEGVLASGSQDTTVLLWDVQAAATQPESILSAKEVEGPIVRARWSSGDFDARDYIKDDGTVAWARPSGQPALTGAVSLATNYSSSCAITSAPAGKVRCWGSTRGGVLGIPEKPGAKPYQFLSEDKPVEVPNVSDAVRVELGGEYGCALQTGGKLSCWGRLGGGNVSAPTEKLTGVTSFKVQSARACALTSSSELSCWETSNAVAPTVLATNVRSFDMGQFHLCFIDASENVSCIGRGAQLGDGTSGERKTPAVVDRLSRVSAISAGRYGTCARARPSGDEEDVYCWGDFDHGDHLVPTRMKGLSGTKGLLVLGGRVCAVKSDKLVCVAK